ncbi:MAG: hypothetical protein QNK23_17825 [Crocinitomicaceae bacterium]|nr:hypothetical protein [Crocinitomicaceae bacterium]
MNKSRTLGLTMLVISLVLAVLIILYYWTNSSFESMKYVPLYVMMMSFGYVLAQIIKRYVVRKQYWWDWLYYIGLIAIVVPTFFASTDNFTTLGWMTDVGTLFLIVPLILDGKKILSTK